jgi:hypothetical protein
VWPTGCRICGDTTGTGQTNLALPFGAVKSKDSGELATFAKQQRRFALWLEADRARNRARPEAPLRQNPIPQYLVEEVTAQAWIPCIASCDCTIILNLADAGRKRLAKVLSQEAMNP